MMYAVSDVYACEEVFHGNSGDTVDFQFMRNAVALRKSDFSKQARVAILACEGLTDREMCEIMGWEPLPSSLH